MTTCATAIHKYLHKFDSIEGTYYAVSVKTSTAYIVDYIQRKKKCPELDLILKDKEWDCSSILITDDNLQQLHENIEKDYCKLNKHIPLRGRRGSTRLSVQKFRRLKFG